MFMEQMCQQLAAIDVLNFQNTTSNVNSAVGIDLAKYRRVLYVLQIGVMNTASTLDARLQTSAQANFNVVANVALTNIAQVLAASNSNTIIKMEVRADQVAAGQRYVRLNCVVAGSSINIGVIGYGCEAVQRPGGGTVGANENTSIVTQNVPCTT